MSRRREGLFWILRMIGIVVLACGMYALIHILSSSGGPVEPMKILFAPTEDDADCTILINRDKTVMIDTGEAGDFAAIDKILKENDITSIDCLILTHPDKDHIGSALEIMENYEVKQVVEPYYDLENERYEAVNDRIGSENIPCLIPTRERKIVLGDMKLTIYPPEEFVYDNDNNYSLAVLISHGEKTLFFPGDAMRKRTEELMGLPVENVDLYKMSYHGRDHEGAKELLEKLDPKILVITASEAEPEVESLLDGKTVFYTVPSGAAFISDGERILEQ